MIVVAFTDACYGPASGAGFDNFRQTVIAYLDAQDAQGIEVCPQASIGKYITPCAVGITPVELPNQDHSVCTPVPPGCPL